MPLVSLDQLTVVGVSPTELVDIAADAGYDAVSAFTSSSDSAGAYRLAKGDERTEAMLARRRERGIAVSNLEGLVVKPRMDWDEYARLIDLGAHIGARRGATVILDKDRARAIDSFCRLAELAANGGLGLTLEFCRLTEVGSLADAVAFVGLASHPVGVLVDLMHLVLGGETPADIARHDPALITAAQLCDSRAMLTDEDYMRDAFHQREIPGDGELPVVDFLKALPDHAAIGLEVPLKSLAEHGMSHLDRARLLLERTRALLAEAGRTADAAAA